LRRAVIAYGNGRHCVETLPWLSLIRDLKPIGQLKFYRHTAILIQKMPGLKGFPSKPGIEYLPNKRFSWSGKPSDQAGNRNAGVATHSQKPGSPVWMPA
jgi:hypothetical protein